ncbi:hypothetical protein CcCBS67573_g09575 [Chytriomyces confervae]|uniref:Guanylate cyclase domain-containing protein n=1 Tax=Chytriomyces confervae TaxID=246404 RepID=A0A507DSH2_9FUNG|nr:hypothetical protein CcCBS67573_g09575 [Chytriomyces confervae]
MSEPTSIANSRSGLNAATANATRLPDTASDSNPLILQSSTPKSSSHAKLALASKNASQSQLISSLSSDANPITPSHRFKDSSMSLASSPSRKNSLPKLDHSTTNHAIPLPPHNQTPPLLHLHAQGSSLISLPFTGNTTSFPPSEATHAVIQSTWALFTAMGDAQRNQLLKGLLSKCSSKQVDLICTSLNLKMSEPLIPGHPSTVFAANGVGKFAPQARHGTARKSAMKSASKAPQPTPLKSNTVDANSLDAFFREIRASNTPTPNQVMQGMPSLLPETTVTSNGASMSTLPESQHHLTPNLYIKLLNTTYDADTLLKQVGLTHSLATTRRLLEFIVQRTSKQQSILACMQHLCNTTNIDGGSGGGMQVAASLLHCAVTATAAGFASLYRVDEATGDISVVASTWAKEGVIDCTSTPASGTAGRGWSKDAGGWAKDASGSPIDRILGGAHLLKGDTVNVFNVKESDIYTDEVHEFYGVSGKCDVECVLSVPVKTGAGKVVGMIEVMNKANAADSPYFNAEDEYMAKCLGSVWTLMLSTAYTRGGDRGVGGAVGGVGGVKKKDDIKMLMNTASFMSSEIDLNGLVRVVMQTAQELMNAERGTVFIVDQKKKELWSVMAQGAGEIRVPMTKGIAGFVAMSGEILNIPNAYKDPRFNRAIDIKTGFHTRNILCIPMKSSKGQVIGVAQIINKLPDPSVFTSEDEMLLTAFSSLAATTIEKNLVFQEMQTLLDESTQQKAHLSKIVSSVGTVIITLESTGKMTSINHPDAFHLDNEALESMKYNAFDMWLDTEANGYLIADIRRVFKGEPYVSCRDYEVRLGGITARVNYAISELLDANSVGSADSVAGAEGAAISKIPPRLSNDSDSDSDSDSSHSSSSSNDSDSISDSNDSIHKRKLKRKQVNKPVIRKKVEGVILSFDLLGDGERIDDCLAKYMPPELVRKVSTEGVSSVDGKREKATCLSIELRNFTKLSESIDAADAVSILSIHYAAVNTLIKEFGGYVDKVLDENAHAVFGLPFPKEVDTFNAVQAAIKLIQTRDEVNKKLLDCSLTSTQIGIGIATGPVLSGVVGPPEKVDYVAMGYAVSFSKQIQRVTKLYGSNLLICEKTQREVRDKFHFREVDQVILKGNAIPVTLYEVLGPSHVELAREVITSTICFELGLSEYRNQNWAVAQLHFKKAIQTFDDGPSKIFVKQFQDLVDGDIKLPADWDGC